MKKNISRYYLILLPLFIIFLLESKLNYASSSDADTTYINALLNRANSFGTSNSDSSIYCFQQAFHLAKQTINDNLINRVFYGYAYELYKQQEFDSLEKLIIQEQGMITETKDSLLIAELKFIYGSTLRWISRLVSSQLSIDG